MTKQPLPVLDPGRTEFGFARTICACPDCNAGCRHLPGYLIPADLDRIRDHMTPGDDLLVWTRQHLLASPGALVSRGEKAFRIPTLVPARRADDACRSLTEEGRCSIHAIAPFGCSFFDSHMTSEEADKRSVEGLRAVLGAWLAGDLYADVWSDLACAGLQAPPPEEGRKRIRQAQGEADTPNKV